MIDFLDDLQAFITEVTKNCPEQPPQPRVQSTVERYITHGLPMYCGKVTVTEYVDDRGRLELCQFTLHTDSTFEEEKARATILKAENYVLQELFKQGIGGRKGRYIEEVSEENRAQR